MNEEYLQILKNLTVLYAEDENVIRESVTNILNFFFGKVLVAKDGIEALTLYNNNTVHVVLLDYVMPIMSGYDVTKEIRAKDDNVPIIIASAYTDKEKLLSAIPLNLVEYIEKPIVYDDLTQVFAAVVDQLKKQNSLHVKFSDTISYSFINKTILTDTKEERLTKKEYEFIETLIKNKNQLVSKQSIKEAIFDEEPDDNTLRNLVYRLRKKVDFKNTLVTVKDLGYILNIQT
jgi:DNA-binding response OmpR family regulator